MKQIILEIQRRFELALEVKTGWERVDIKTLYNKIVIDVLTEYIVVPTDIPTSNVNDRIVPIVEETTRPQLISEAINSIDDDLPF